MISRAIYKAKYAFNLLKKLSFKDSISLIEPCDFLLFCNDASRSISLNNKAYSPLMDSLKDEIESKGFTCITVAHPWAIFVDKYAYGSPIAMNRSYFFSKLIKKIFGRISARPDLKLYERIISRANPKVVITIGCSSELCEAARNLNIFHVELLHGIGYASMKWNWDKKKQQHLPQGILSLDPVSTQTFLELEKKGVVVKEIPHPFLRRFQDKRLDAMPNEWKPAKKGNQYKKEILISLQWGYASGIDELKQFNGILANGLFYDELEEVITQTCYKVFWRFRLHPVQYRNPKKYKKLFKFIECFVENHENCDWKESTYIPLPSLLPRCSGHITMSSMCSYEAAYLGVPTLALAPSLKDGGVLENIFNDLVEKGYLIKETATVDGILDWVNKVEKKPHLLTNLVETDNTVDWLLSRVKA